MLGEMLESMKILRNRLKYKKDKKQKVKFVLSGDVWGSVEKQYNSLTVSEIPKNTMGKQGLLIRGCLGRGWRAVNNLNTIEQSKKSYGNTRCSNARIIGEIL